MAEREAHIKVGVQGAQQAEQDLQRLAGAERAVGDGAASAGKESEQAGQRGQSAFARMGGQVDGLVTQVNRLLGAFVGFKLVMETFQNIRQELERIDELARRAAGRAGEADTRALANVRGTSQSAALLSTMEQARRADVAPETARQAAFIIESGLAPADVGGPAGIAAIEQAALQTAAVSGASGATVGGLAITAREALGAGTPEQFQAFYAKALTYAKQSRVSLEDLGGILNETLPLAVKAGIDPDAFMARAAAMSYRIKDPGMVRTALRQMIAATTRPSKDLSKLAAEAGMDLSKASASDIMEFQATSLERASAAGPQATGKMSERLGLTPEIGQVYLQTADRAANVRMAGLAERGRQATWSGTVGEEFGRLMLDPLSRLRRAQLDRQIQETRRGIAQAGLVAEAEEAQARFEAGLVAGDTLTGMDAMIPGGRGSRVRQDVAASVRNGLLDVAENPALPPELRQRAREALGELGGVGDLFQDIVGVGDRGDLLAGQAIIQEAQQLVGGPAVGPAHPRSGAQGGPAAGTPEATDRVGAAPPAGPVFHGGTHYHVSDREDPAGKPRPAVGEF